MPRFLNAAKATRFWQVRPNSDYALNLVSGLFLMLTLRSALHAAPWAMTMGLFAASGAAHGIDLWRRWVRRPG